MRRVVSREPEMAVFSSAIFRQRTVEVWPRKVCRQALNMMLVTAVVSE